MRQDVGWLLQGRWRNWFYRGGGRPAEYVAPLRLRLFLVVGDYKYFTPLALRAGRVTSGRNAFSVDGHVERLPSVAVPASRQRWAEGRDPFGVNRRPGRTPAWLQTPSTIRWGADARPMRAHSRQPVLFAVF